jgi:hypothetical protein
MNRLRCAGVLALIFSSVGVAGLSFEANRGQAPAGVQFLSRGPGYSLRLSGDEVALNALRMKLVGANPHAAVSGDDPQAGVVSYFIGNDVKKWHTGIPTYGKVCYTQIYPGVDLVFYGNQRQLEYDFVIAPGADSKRIGWQIDGARAVLDAEGNLVLGSASFKKPVVYQMDGDRRVSVQGWYEVAANRVRFRLGSYDHARPLIIDPVLSYVSYLGGSNTDQIGNYLDFYPGGNNGTTQALAVDSAGSIYVTGYTYSSDFPMQAAYQGAPPAKMSGSNWPSVFVSKFSPDGGSLVYSTYIGGNGLDYGYAIAVDWDGEAYVTGTTTSPDFPITPGAYQAICSPQPVLTANGTEEAPACNSFYNASAFVTKLNSSGTGLVYSTFLSGTDGATADAIAVDVFGNTYIAGSVQGYCRPGYSYTCFPTTTGAVISGSQTQAGEPQNAFVAVFDPTGSELLYSTIFGDLNGLCTENCIDHPGNGGTTYGTGVAVDANGNFYLTGSTMAGNLPTTPGAIQQMSGPLNPNEEAMLLGIHGFVAKFYPVTPKGTTLEAATYLGGHTTNLADYISGITTDGAGYSYVTGFTQSPDFPVTAGAYQTTCVTQQSSHYCVSAYVAKLNPSLSNIEWATYLGDLTGAGDNVALTGGIQLDANGNVYIAGQTSSGGFPWVNPIEPDAGGFQEAFVAEFDPTGSQLLFSTPIGNGGAGNNAAYSPAGLGVDGLGNVYFAGYTQDPGLIVTPGAFQTSSTDGPCCSYGNGFVVKIAPQSTANVALVVSPSASTAGEMVTLTATVSQTQQYASAPTGMVAFVDGSTVLSLMPLSSAGTAVYSTSALASGSHNLSAVYGGDSTYPMVSAAQTLAVK